MQGDVKKKKNSLQLAYSVLNWTEGAFLIDFFLISIDICLSMTISLGNVRNIKGEVIKMRRYLFGTSFAKWIKLNCF